MNSKIIGLTGAFGSGKSTAAAFFKELGFYKIVLSEFLEEEAKKRGTTDITRKVLQDIGNEWREKYGASVLAKKALHEILVGKHEKVVIDGIRNIGEIKYLRNSGNFTLAAVVSDRKTRFERLRKLKRRENLTWELFEKLDARDSGVGERGTGLQVDRCIELANITIKNNRNEEDFKNKLKQVLDKYGK